MYVLPNRKAFADSITRILMKYRSIPTDQEDKDVDVCAQRGSNARELLPHQKIVRDYLLMETPYRGLLLYHGLGSGKTCSSIAVAESLLSNRKVYVLSPASLEANYRGELRKCGDPIYMFEQYWIERELTEKTRPEALKLGISESFIDRHAKFYVTDPNQKNPNYKQLSKETQIGISEQIEDTINQRFTFIHYNGLKANTIEKYAPAEGPNPYDNSVVVIDEVHNLIGMIANSSNIATKLYDKIYRAKDCKVVALSGTPVINRPVEIAFLMNLLRGPIERIKVPLGKFEGTWDEEKMIQVLRSVPDIDTIEFINTAQKYILVTRNPPHFRTVYNDKGDRLAVQYNKDVPFIPIPSDWVKSWKNNFETEMAGFNIEVDRITTEELQCLPTDPDEFGMMFLDGLEIKNAMLFQRRIQGLVSYFKGADERMLPRRVDDDKMLERVPMSSEQFNYYLGVRYDEIKQDAKKARNYNKDSDDEMKTFRVNSRLACNYAVPPEFRSREGEPQNANEDNVPDKEDIINKLRESPDRFLSEKGLEIFSPKLLKMLQNIKETGPEKNQFIYSQYRQLEGLGIFAAVLDSNGWQQYRITKDQNGQWIEDPSMDPDKPAYTFYTGGSGVGFEEVVSEKNTEGANAIKRYGMNKEQRELTRQIFNGRYEDNFPPSLKQSVEANPKKRLSLLMASSSGAEGITLANVRHVHIMEPHWNPARHDQVIGRAIRICSHATLPLEQRTVRISFYVSTFSEEDSKSTAESTNVVPVRRADTTLRQYEGKEKQTEVFMSTDEYLYEKAYEKDITNKRISLLLKQAAVDCEVHRNLHKKEKPVISCMRFDSTTTSEDLAFRPNMKNDDKDLTYLRNMSRKSRVLHKVLIKNILLYIDPESGEVFDGPAFDDNKRLLRLGIKTSNTSIKWLPDLRLE